MGIDLGGRDVGVTEQGLHDAQVRAVVQQMAGKGVAQHVRETRRACKPDATASSLRSRAKCWRVRCRLSPNEGNSHFDAATLFFLSAFAASVAAR